MPNHIQNKLQIIGDNVDKIRVYIKGDEDHPNIDFNNIIPMPESLMIECHTGVINAVKNALKMDVHDNNLIGMLEAENRQNQGSPLEFGDEDWKHFIQCLKNKREHGYLYWYEWAVDNWGTKWNAYGQNDDRNTLDTIYFETAWSMPENVIKELSKKFPDNEFKIEWASEDTGYNVGMKHFHNGEIIGKRIPEGGTNEAYEFCFALNPHKEEFYKLENGEYVFEDTEL